MTEIYGNFNEEMVNQAQLLRLSFDPSFLSPQQQWQHNGLLANFIADYITPLASSDEGTPHCIEQVIYLKGSISYIANELLENAIKFHVKRPKIPIDFSLLFINQTIVLLSKNLILIYQYEILKNVIKELTTSNLEDLYIQRVETLAEQENSTASGLGLITILSDYSAQIGWKIEAYEPDTTLKTVTTMVQLPIEQY